MDETANIRTPRKCFCCRCGKPFRNEAVLEADDGRVHWQCLTREECEERNLPCAADAPPLPPWPPRPAA